MPRTGGGSGGAEAVDTIAPRAGDLPSRPEALMSPGVTIWNHFGAVPGFAVAGKCVAGRPGGGHPVEIG